MARTRRTLTSLWNPDSRTNRLATLPHEEVCTAGRRRRHVRAASRMDAVESPRSSRPEAPVAASVIRWRDGWRSTRWYLYITIGAGRPTTATPTVRRTCRSRWQTSLPDDGRFLPPPLCGRSGPCPSWSDGHRNAQGMAFHQRRATVAERRGSRGRRANVIRRGANYGGRSRASAVNQWRRTRRHGAPMGWAAGTHWRPHRSVRDMITRRRFPTWRGNIFVPAPADQQLSRVPW